MLTKREAAARLVRSAIIARIRNDDPLPIHLCVFSAIRVLSDLRSAQGLPPLIFGKWIHQDVFRTFLVSFYEVNNFLKHADRDPNAAINIEHIGKLNELGIIAAIESLASVGYDFHRDFWMLYFRAEFVIHNPECIDPEASQEWIDHTTRVWKAIRLDFVVEVARNPETYRTEFEVMAAQVLPGLRI